jgi:hypothetical protein
MCKFAQLYACHELFLNQANQPYTNYIKQKLLKIYMKREVGILDCLAEIFKHK